MLTLNDGRNELWQWDTGRKLEVDVDCSQVHFSNKVFGRSIDVDVVDGVATIPDILLQTDKELNVWAFVGTAENGYTKISKIFKVNRRNKPADYVFTPPEQTSLEEIKEKIEYLESIQDPDAIKNAVEDYLEQNPVEAPVQSVNGHTGEVKLTAEDVGAISQDDLQEATNKALEQAKESGEFKGDPGYTPQKGKDYFDGDDYVLTPEDKKEIAEMAADLVKVPDSGGNVDYVGVEPAYDDIPKIFFGGALQQTKDEKVVPFRYISKTDDFSGYAEIKAQGNSSMSYPKKNQTVKMFADEACETKMKKDFKGWGKQNKHVYKANWIDLSHARNVVSARLWADVVKSRADYESLPELLRTSPNQGAVDGFPVKVYADGVYQGRYTLNIPKDKWTFNMDDELDNHCVLCGENYASGCFRAAANINGSDWTDEIHDTVPASIKTRWNEVISFVMNSTDEEFRANLSQYFYVDSLIDYYLFGLASCGLDAFGKNQIYATYDGQKWIASMYDMDSTWGLYWNGSKFVSTSYGRNEYEDYVHTDGNLLYNRLEQLFYEEMQTRWAELKNGALSIENIINRFERFTDIAPAELVKDDYASTTGGGKFTGIPSKDTNNIQQIRAFALARLAWTDEYISALSGEGGGEEEPDEPEVPEAVPCTGITLDKTELTFDGEGTQTLTATVTPDGCTDAVTWESNNNSVATVSGGVVTAVANGSATITARCGNYSASCTVTVSGIVALTWSNTNTYEIDTTTGETVEGDKYISDLFPVENGYVYELYQGEGTSFGWLECGQYDVDGNFIRFTKNDSKDKILRFSSPATAEFDPDGKFPVVAQVRLLAYPVNATTDTSPYDMSIRKTSYMWTPEPAYNIGNNGQMTTQYASTNLSVKKISVEPGATYTLANTNDAVTFEWLTVAEYDNSGALVKFTNGAASTGITTVTMTDTTAYVMLCASATDRLAGRYSVKAMHARLVDDYVTFTKVT